MLQEPDPSEAFVMASPVLKPYMLVTYGNSSVVVQSSIVITSLVGPLTKRGISSSVPLLHGMIAHGNGTHIERRLSRLPRERDLHGHSILSCCRLYGENQSHIIDHIPHGSTSSPGKPVSNLYMASPAPTDDRVDYAVFVSAFVRPGYQVKRGQIAHILLQCRSGLPSGSPSRSRRRECRGNSTRGRLFRADVDRP